MSSTDYYSIVKFIYQEVSESHYFRWFK